MRLLNNMSNIHSVVLIVALWAIYLIVISLFKKRIKEKKETWSRKSFFSVLKGGGDFGVNQVRGMRN